MENEFEEKSNKQLKREKDEIKELGNELSKISPSQLKNIEIPDDLRTALEDARSITSNVARKRHKLFIASLMLGVEDPAPIREALLKIKAGRHIESEIAKKTRVWREKLTSGDTALVEEFISDFPVVDRQSLKQLLRNIAKEKKIGKSKKSLKILGKLILKTLSES